MKTRTTIFALLFALIFSILGAVPSNAAPIETSRATAKVTTDLTGKVIVRVKYEDFGYLGVKPVKVCAHDNPNSLSRTIRVTFRYNTFIVVNMGEYKAGKAKCKTIPFSKRKRTTDRNWDAYGKAVVWRLGFVDVFQGPFAVASRML